MLGGLGSKLPFGGNKDASPAKPGEKKDEPKSGGMLGGLGSKLPFGGSKDAAPAKPGEKKDEPKSGGMLGGLGSKLPFGGSKDAAPAKPGEKKDEPKSGGLLGGLSSKLPFGGNKDAAPAAKPAATSAPGTPGAAPRPGGFGAPSPAPGAKPAAPAAEEKSGGLFGRPFGKLGGNATPASSTAAGGAKPAAKADAKAGGLGRFLPFFGSKETAKPAAKPRTSKAPKVESGGLTLDNKLDILGVSLVLGSLMMIFSRLSPTRGAITEQINSTLNTLFGWGSLAIPIAMLAVGIWLIARHFGDEAPVVPRNRIIGIIISYFGLLILLTYIETFNYVGGRAVRSLTELGLQLQLSYEVYGAGGGRIGAEAYYFLVTNFTEMGAFFLMALVLVVGAMFTFEISAAEMAMIVIGNVRAVQDAFGRRRQRAAAQRANSLEQLTAQAQQPVVTVSKPAEALPAAPATPALPAQSPGALPALADPALAAAAERNISINIGGRKDAPATPAPAGLFAGKPEMATAEKAAAASAPSAKPATPGGLAARLGSALPSIKLPGSKPETPAPETAPKPTMASSAPAGDGAGMATTAAAAAAGGIRGLFNRNKPEDKPASPPGATTPPPASSPVTSSTSPVTAFQPPAVPAQPAMSSPVSGEVRTSPLMPPAATSAPPVATAPAAPPARLGDLMKPADANRPAVTSGPASPVRSSPLTPAASVTPAAPTPANPAAPSSVRSFGVTPPAGSTENTGAVSGRPAASSPFKSSPTIRPEDFLDDLDEDDEEIRDIVEDDEDDDMLSRLPPAQPKGTPINPNRPTESRFAPTTFNRPAASQPTGNDRMGRLNELRQGGAFAPASVTKPDSDKPAVEKPAASAAPSISTSSSGGILGQTPRSPGAPPGPAAPAENRPAASAVTPPSASPIKPPGPPTTTTPATSPAQTVPATPSSVTLPAADVTKAAEPVKTPMPMSNLPTAAGPSPAFGRPETPPIAGAMPLTASVTPLPRDEAGVTPPPKSPELVMRPPGTGPTAPSAGVSSRRKKEWRLPSMSQLLVQGSEGDFDREGLLRRARIIEDTLGSFGAPGKVVEVNTGPVITQFGVEPDYLVTRGGKKNRVKVSAIAQLDKDMQLALGAKSIRVEAPVPGKGYVGIEVPNDAPSLVSLRDVMEAESFRKLANKSPLAIALGQSVDGTPISADLSSMPHLLIAGTTGSGKSVCVNSIITSLLVLNPPDRVKFIMVDPKRVELTGYNGIPHLIAPVVVELERIVGVLKWVTREMDERYKKFSQAGARNIEDFNKHLNETEERMPYIVVIIDELADLMMLAPDETERVITRIAALARATGIHLVIATQRPSVDVVTGLIKANFPARIAFAVAGGVDSRVILDQPGAERLLGRGDMLYMSGDSPAPLRLQGVYVSDNEINNITRFWRAQVSPEDVAARPISALVVDNTVVEPSKAALQGSDKQQLQQAFWDSDTNRSSTTTVSSSAGDDDSGDSDDVLYEEAVEMVRRLEKASVSLLQRRLRIGYTRAARLIDRMEAEGIVGPAVEGSKPREVIKNFKA